MRTKILLSLTVIALGVAMSTTTMAAQDSEASTVNVSVTQELAVNVAPENFVYTNDPGTFNDTSANGYTGIEIENTGSRNISEVWLDTSAPSDRPFGSGESAQYDAGNFIQAKPSAEIEGIIDPPNGDNFAYISRKDFNESNTLSYFKEPSGEGAIRYGRFRVANESFFWAVTNAETGQTPNQCTGEGGTPSELLVGEDPHSETQTGSVDFTDSANYNRYELNSTESTQAYGRADSVSLDTYEGTINHTFLSWCGNSADTNDNSTHVFGARWGLEEKGGSSTLSTATDSLEYILSRVSDSTEFQPGEHFTVFTRVAVPNAVAQGEVSQGDLTVFVSDANV